MPNNPSYVASESIEPARFVNILAGSNHKIERCDAGDLAHGVTQKALCKAYPDATTYAVESGESCLIHGPGDSCEVLLGGTVGAGGYIKPDATGKGVAAASAEKYSAWCRAGGISGELAQIILEHGVTP